MDFQLKVCWQQFRLLRHFSSNESAATVKRISQAIKIDVLWDVDQHDCILHDLALINDLCGTKS
jgi:hypothetical protein